MRDMPQVGVLFTRYTCTGTIPGLRLPGFWNYLKGNSVNTNLLNGLPRSRILTPILLLGMLVGTNHCFAEEPSAKAEKQSFWQRLKSGVTIGTQQSLSDRKGKSNWRVETQGPIFEPLDPPSGGQFQGLFASDDHQLAQQGQLAWPRVAITFVEYGGALPCWTLRARIWSSPKSNTVETFRICNAPVGDTDDLGQEAVIDDASLFYLNSRLNGLRVMTGEHTSTQRTEGPLPPLKPWDINIARENYTPSPISLQLTNILPRLAWASGYANEEDIFRGNATLATGFRDPRMWYVGFDPKGNRDAQP